MHEKKIGKCKKEKETRDISFLIPLRRNDVLFQQKQIHAHSSCAPSQHVGQQIKQSYGRPIIHPLV